MKIKLVFSLFALLIFASVTANAQSLTLENKSDCDVQVVLTASANSCKPAASCQTGTVTIQARSTAVIALPTNCPAAWTPTFFYRIDLNDNGTLVTVGINCGLPSSQTYTDCNSDSRTLVMSNATTATIF